MATSLCPVFQTALFLGGPPFLKSGVRIRFLDGVFSILHEYWLKKHGWRIINVDI